MARGAPRDRILLGDALECVLAVVATAMLVKVFRTFSVVDLAKQSLCLLNRRQHLLSDVSVTYISVLSKSSLCRTILYRSTVACTKSRSQRGPTAKKQAERQLPHTLRYAAEAIALEQYNDAQAQGQ